MILRICCRILLSQTYTAERNGAPSNSKVRNNVSDGSVCEQVGGGEGGIEEDTCWLEREKEGLEREKEKERERERERGKGG